LWHSNGGHNWTPEKGKEWQRGRRLYGGGW
jgi:hypothetical protein